MPGIEYYSFEKVLKELQIEEEELKRLVSEGEIRAFREGDTIKFKRSDIEGLKKGKMTEPTIILPSGESEEPSEDSEVLLVEEDTSETLLDLDEADATESSSTTIPTVDFGTSSSESPVDAPSDSEIVSDSNSNIVPESSESEPAAEEAKSASANITEDLKFEPESGSFPMEPSSDSDDVLIDSSQELAPVEEGTSGETFIDSDTGLLTEPLVLSNQTSVGTAPSSEEGMTTPVEEVVTAPVKEGTKPKKALPRMVPQAIEEPISNSVMGALVATMVLLLFSGVVMINTLKEIDTPLTGWLTDLTFKIAPAKYVADKKLEKHMQWRENKREKPDRIYSKLGD